jgi:Poly A polymerase head domain/Probable RNA and SrmB- binding site of polymerase A
MSDADDAAAAAGSGSGPGSGSGSGSGSEAASIAVFAELCRDPVVLELVAACGATECHLVGGVLRDRLLGLATHDLDAVVAGRGEAIAGELAARLPARLVRLGGEDFAAYRLVLGVPAPSSPSGPSAASTASAATGAAVPSPHRILDLWDRKSLPLHDDLARRDFTVNSIALAPRDGAVVDPFGGLADLARRVLRATTARSFEGDPLRVLRLARLLVRLPGFAVDPETFELARRAAPRLPEIAAERIREELWLTLSQPASERPGGRGTAAGAEHAGSGGRITDDGHAGDPGDPGDAGAAEPGVATSPAVVGLRALAALDVYPGLWLGAPGIPGGREGAAAAARAAAELAALPACAAELERLLANGSPDPRAGAPRPAIDLAAARFGATFRSLPGAAARGAAADGPAAAAAAATGAEAAGTAAMAAAGRMQEAGYVSSRQMAEIAPLLAEPAELPETDLERRRFLHRHGWRWLTVACSWGGAAAAAGGDAPERWRQAAEPLCELARREGPELIEPPRLLTGDDVQRLLGVAAGPRVGAALAALTAAQVAGAVRTRGEAERFLGDWRVRLAGETG